MTAPTARQETLAGSGEHHLELCLEQSAERDLAGGPWRFFCERPMRHYGQPHAAEVEDGYSIEWAGPIIGGA